MKSPILHVLLSPLFAPKRPVSLTEQPSGHSPIQSLKYYDTPGVFPPSARVDPKLKLRPRRPLHFWEYWKYPAFLAAKATELTTDVLSHQIWGPRKKSWGIEMTIATSLVRGTGHHAGLIDIGTMRMLMGIGGLVPLPSDALATPVTFRVRKRNLRGILASFDALETGTRELSGEWLVGKQTWQRLQNEWKSSTQSSSEKVGPSKKERIVLYIHGGAYYFSSAAAQRMISIPLTRYTDARLFAIDYRLAPETHFPGPLHDVACAYLRLVEDLHIPAENIIVSGDSAGGGLALALLMYLRDNYYPLPSGAILLSPWVDLTLSCESWDTNAMNDIVPFPVMDSHLNPIALYLGEQAEQYLTHPYASPLFGTFEGLPPLLIQAGDAEVLRDEITLLAHKARLAGVHVRHELYDDAVHVFQAWPFFSATSRAFESMGHFVHNILPKYSRSPQYLGDTAEKVMAGEIENERAVVVGRDGVEKNMKDGSVKQKFSNEPDTPVTPGEIEETPSDDGYWEVEDVWHENNWLRGDGEEGQIYPSTQRNIDHRSPRGIVRFTLDGGSELDSGSDSDEETSGWRAESSFLSPGLKVPFLSATSTSMVIPQYHLDNQPSDYFFHPLFPLRRTKSTTNITVTDDRRTSTVPMSTVRRIKSLTSFLSSCSSCSPSPSSETAPITPPSTPSLGLDCSLASRLCALPHWTLTASTRNLNSEGHKEIHGKAGMVGKKSSTAQSTVMQLKLPRCVRSLSNVKNPRLEALDGISETL